MNEKSEDKKGYNVLQNIIHLLGMAYKHYKIVFLFILLEIICSGLLPLFGLYLPKLAVELVLENQGLTHVMLTLGGFAAVYVLLQCINNVASQGKYPFQNSLRFMYMRAIFEKALDCDYNIMESSEGQTWYEKARSTIDLGDSSMTTLILNYTTAIISALISFMFIFGIIAQLNIFILMLLILLSFTTYIIGNIFQKGWKRVRELIHPYYRKRGYLEYAMSNTVAAKDIRIYNLSSLFIDIRDKLLRDMKQAYTKMNNFSFKEDMVNRLLSVVRDIIAYAYCIREVINGGITVPEFVLYMGAIASFSGWMNDIITKIMRLKRSSIDFNDLRSFFEYTNKMDPKQPLPISKIAHPIDIEFKNVGFRYTSNTPKILDGLSFHIRTNEKIALVGVNGAGKTTIVKLLCGFYKVNEGEILINGYNIDLFKRSDLYTLFSAVFQDICILPVTAGENISFINADKSGEERLLRCLEIAGIKDEIMKHDKKLNAPMLKVLDEDGIMLSGGQQQKLLLARALYKDAPILILDEPTAALDPIAESEVYEKFYEVTKNKMAVYISHRLASTRFCDKILMLKDGRIIESGNHNELIAKNGEYAYMFDIQSHYYKQEGNAV